MKVLLIHNYYSSLKPSGENRAFLLENDLLRKNGVQTVPFVRSSDEIVGKGTVGIIRGALSTPWNPWSARAIRGAVQRNRPNVVHVHNSFPLISPSVFYSVADGVAKILSLHNYRVFCPAAIPMRQGKVCLECFETRSTKPSITYGCYRHSRIATLPLALGVWLHRAMGTWSNKVDAFIALSDFQRDLMVEAGLPREKVHVKPNFYPGNPSVTPWSDRKPCVVFAGRLTAEKGVVNLMRAWQTWGPLAPELRLIGDGELRQTLEHMAVGLPVRFLGQLSAEGTHAEIARARLLVLPSECLETFGLVVVEAFAHGTPAAVSSIGALSGIVRGGRSGVVFKPANPESLLDEVRKAWNTPGLLEQLGRGARTEFESKYTEDANYASLMDIYRQAIEVSRHG